MRTDDIALVRLGFTTVLVDQENFTTRFYRALFRIEPGLVAAFGEDLVVPAKQFVRALGQAVQAMDRLDLVRDDLRALGRRHVDYGVENWHYGIAGEALLDALEATLGEAFDQRARAAWAIFYAHLADVMSGADDADGGRMAVGRTIRPPRLATVRKSGRLRRHPATVEFRLT